MTLFRARRAAMVVMIAGLLGAALIPSTGALAQARDEPLCANPYVAQLPVECSPDYEYWDGQIATLADSRSQNREGGGADSTVLYDEAEQGAAATNNIQASAEVLADFGTGIGENDGVDVAGELVSGDADFYSFELEPGDVIGASVTGGAGLLRLHQPHGSVLVDSISDGSGLYPATSPLPGGGAEAVVSYVIDVAGTYAIGVNPDYGPGPGSYLLELRVFRPELESRPSATQILFVDFDGAFIADRTIFGGPTGSTTLDPLSSFLAGWGLTPADEDAVIDAIMATVEENFGDVAEDGHNGHHGVSGLPGEFEIEIRNSRDDADPWGSANVSRIVVGGTTAQLGVSAVGIAESIDVGNFALEEEGVALLDLRSADASNPNSLNSVPLDPGATIIDLIGVVVGNTVSHEAGHFFGNWHVDSSNATIDVMDRGGIAAAEKSSLGRDRVFGTADDIDRDFGMDTYSPLEAFLGVENTMNVVSFGLSTPVPPPVCPATVATETDLVDCIAVYDAADAGTTTAVTLGADITLTTTLPALNNNTSATFSVIGNGHIIDGGGDAATIFRMIDGSAALTNVTLTGATARALRVSGGSAAVTASTITDNNAGLYIDGGSIVVDNSTIALHASSGIELVGGAATIRSSTVVDSGSTGLVGSPEVSGSIVARSGTDCSELLGAGDLGGNLFEDTSCNGSATAGLGSSLGQTIDANGCTFPCTETIAVLPGSPAFNVAGACGLASDQRGLARVTGRCDAGSFEFQDTTAPTVALVPTIEAAVFARNAVVPVTFTCTDDVAGSGISSCAGDVDSGELLDTTTAGTFTFTVTAADYAGNTTEIIAEYTVAPDAFCDGELVTINMTIPGVSGVGTTGDDVILGTNKADVIRGRGGDDVICGGGAGDDIDGGRGADRIFGEDGPDLIAGGPGRDHISGGQGADTIFGQDGADTIDGGSGNDEINGQGAPDTIDGGHGPDVISGQEGADVLRGGDGNDTVKGHVGPDIIEGGRQNDGLFGGEGNDILWGGDGNDKCSGNTGTDQAEAATCEQMPGIEATF